MVFHSDGNPKETGLFSMTREILSTNQKALQINRDRSKYGTFAEIGAGQEVARFFFKVGGAAGTIAKSISAYDMTVSDAIYGSTARYVSRQRLRSMLDCEFGLLRKRLDQPIGADTTFFAFANTVKAISFGGAGESHGWLGIRFQVAPQTEPSEIIIHIRMLDESNLLQQEAIGIFGVNVIHGAFFLHNNLVAFLESLVDNLTSKRVEVDMIKLSGPIFKGEDNRILSLELVRLGLADSAMFTSNGDVVQPSEILYKKAILVERGSFRPVTRVTLNMLDCAKAQFVQDPKVQGSDITVLTEITLRNLAEDGKIDHKDFLDRVDLLGALGKTVLISNYGRFYRLAAYLFRYTDKMIGLAMGVPTLKEIFEEKYYTDLEGGILESFGRLFKNDLKLYIYPLMEAKTGAVIKAANLQVAPNLRHLYAHLFENQYLLDLSGYDESCLPIFSRDVLSKIRSADPSWEEMVPDQVAALIKTRGLFGCQG